MHELYEYSRRQARRRADDVAGAQQGHGLESTCSVARNRYSQLACHEGAVHRCARNLSWAHMGHRGLLLTTDCNIWLLDGRGGEAPVVHEQELVAAGRQRPVLHARLGTCIILKAVL